MQKFEDISPDTSAHWLSVSGDWRRPKAAASYEVLWDASRSFGQIWPRPETADVVAFYELDTYYTHQNSIGQVNAKASIWQRIQTKLSWILDKGIEPDLGWWKSVLGSKKLRVLEIGCGNGANLSTFRTLGHEVVGVEPDALARAVAAENGHLVYSGTAEQLPTELEQEKFDVVVFMHVLEHCINPGLAVGNAVTLLDRGGLLIAEVPNNECHGAKQFGELWHWLDVPRHLNFFTAQSLVELITSSGLSSQHIDFRGYCRQFNPSWKRAQASIAEVFGAKGDKRTTNFSYWQYFFETAWSKKERKYDSVRVIGKLQ